MVFYGLPAAVLFSVVALAFVCARRTGIQERNRLRRVLESQRSLSQRFDDLDDAQKRRSEE